MDWPVNYHSKGQPRRGKLLQLWTLTTLVLLCAFLDCTISVGGESSPPVADVEDLFKDEGFLRMSRGGEAFGRRPPPPPLIHGPPHSFSTQQPPRAFPTASPKERASKPSTFSTTGLRGDQDKQQISPDHLTSTRGGGVNVGATNSRSGGRNGEENRTSSDSKPLSRDENTGFSKEAEGGGGNSADSSSSGAESDAHPLLGITPAAPGEAFDFNPILSNPAVTRILAGSSGRIPQWEPTMPELHGFHDLELIPEVNYTVDIANQRGGGHGQTNPLIPSTSNRQPFPPPTSSGSNVVSTHHPPHPPLPPHHGAPSKTPLFVPSPVSSKTSPTMYNMDQLTNNIAIPKHTLPNPSNLATSRSTVVVDDRGDGHANGNGDGGSQGGAMGGEDRGDTYSHLDRYGPNSSSGTDNAGSSTRNYLDESRPGESPYTYDDDEDSLNEESKGYMGSSSSSSGGGGAEAQGKRGTWKTEDQSDSRDGSNGPKYIVCDALCGAWKHQCKLMGILFSITSALCLLLSLVVLHSLHFSLRDFAPFSIILLFLFTASVSRSAILLSGWFCSPDAADAVRPQWLPVISTLPAPLFVTVFLVTLHLARFHFPFVRSWNTMPAYVIVIVSVGSILIPLCLSVGAYLHPPGHIVLTQSAWIAAHIMLAIVSLVYLFRFKSFYSRLSHERGNSGLSNGGGIGGVGISSVPCAGNGTGVGNGSCNLSSLKKRGYVARWGCLQARAMFGAALLALTLSIMIIISVSMNRGECEKSSTWTGWVLSLCARMLEFAIVILLLVVSVFSVDVRFIRLTRVSLNKTNVGLINGDIYPTMVSSNAAAQRCIPLYSSNARTDVMMLGATENRSSLRGKTFGERTLPGERIGEYRSSVGRGLPLRLGNNAPSHSLPGTPVDGFPQGLKLPEPAPASLLVTKVVFGKPVSREVSHSHQHENPLLCTGGPGSKEESNNIYASLESVKITPFPNPGSSSTGSNHSGSDRVLLSAPRDYIYSISRDLTKTIDSIYDASRPRTNNLPHPYDAMCPQLAHTVEHLGSIPNLNGNHIGRSAHFNFHPHGMHNNGGGNLNPGRTDLARTIERIRYAAAAGAGPPSGHLTTNPGSHPGRNFVLQLGNPNPNSNHILGVGNPPPYCSSESSHDVTPDSGISVNSGRNDAPENVYSRECKRSSVEDIRRLPLLPLQKHRTTPGQTPLYDRTPTSPTNPSSVSSPSAANAPASPLYTTNNPPQPHVVGRVEHLLNQTEHILSRTESLDSNSHSAGIQRLLSHKEQLEHVERLLAQAEYAIWLEKRTAQQVSHLTAGDALNSPYGYAPPLPLLPPLLPNGSSSIASPVFPSAKSISAVQCKDTTVSPSSIRDNVNNHNTNSSSGTNCANVLSNHAKKISRSLEEESVV